MKVALAQINTSMGAISENCARMDRFLREARSKGADLTIFPELAVIGYPPKDLLDQQGFMQRGQEALEKLASHHADQNFIVGGVEAKGQKGIGRFNSAFLISQGKILFSQPKQLLPTYDIFDEARYFDSGEESNVFSLGHLKVGLTICEDIWTDEEFLGKSLYQKRPIQSLNQQGADLFINLSASPFHLGKPETLFRLAQKTVSVTGKPFLLVNLVGGNDEILFHGGSFALDHRGKLLGRAKVFQEDLLVIDLDKSSGKIETWPEKEEVWNYQALAMGLHDYVKKTGFSKVLLGLSGGIDSSLVALLAAQALGPKNVMGVSMPSRYTSQESQEDAESQAKAMGIDFVTLPIEPMFRSFEESLEGVFKGFPRDVTEENIQARIRGNLLMALSNKFRALLLSTGNKSELAVGYCTQYGDLTGGLAVISDLPKQSVYRMARELNQKWNQAIPERVFVRPPTAELAPNQKDQDSLPPYDVLDMIVNAYIEDQQSIASMVQSGMDPHWVEKVVMMIDRNEFKRRQAPPGLRLTSKAFGIGRRMPVARGAL